MENECDGGKEMSFARLLIDGERGGVWSVKCVMMRVKLYMQCKRSVKCVMMRLKLFGRIHVADSDWPLCYSAPNLIVRCCRKL